MGKRWSPVIVSGAVLLAAAVALDTAAGEFAAASAAAVSAEIQLKNRDIINISH